MDKRVRRLSGIYFRLLRSDKNVSIDFTDMTEEEQRCLISSMSVRKKDEMIIFLARRIYEIGEKIGLEWMPLEEEARYKS